MPAGMPPPAADPVRLTALLAAAAWALGVGCLLAAPRSRAARGLWLAGWVAALTHVVVALDVAHGWSHADVLAHSERVAGFGPGVYANAPFLIAWLADAVIRVARPAGPSRRWALAVHGFLAFIVFNATVVYGSWPARALGVGMFLGLAWVWWRRRGDKPSEP